MSIHLLGTGGRPDAHYGGGREFIVVHFCGPVSRSAEFVGVAADYELDITRMIMILHLYMQPLGLWHVL